MDSLIFFRSDVFIGYIYCVMRWTVKRNSHKSFIHADRLQYTNISTYSSARISTCKHVRLEDDINYRTLKLRACRTPVQ